MARGRYYHDPSRKHLEQYQDFSGGLNNMSSNDNTKDNELVQLQNVDLGDRGSLKRRKGYQSQENLDANGKAQMLHRFHRRYAPYNLLGVEGSFDGIRQKNGEHVSIGSWYAFLDDENNAYKVDREGKDQLIYNSDFEQGEKGWHLNVDRHVVGESVVGRSAFALSGRNVLRLSYYKNHSGFLNEYQTKDAEIDVKQGDIIKVKVNYRRAAYSLGHAPHRAHIVASFRYKDGSIKREYIRRYDVGNEWKVMEGEFKTPKNAVACRLGLGIFENNIDNPTAIYYDNFEAYKVSENIAMNGNFENGDKYWLLDNAEGWQSHVGTSIYAYNGENVLRINKTGYSDVTILNEYQDMEIDVKPGDRIRMSVRYRRSAYSFGEAPNRVHLALHHWNDHGENFRNYYRRYDVGNEWKYMEYTFTVPEGIYRVSPAVGVHEQYAKDVGVYFDDFKLYKEEKVDLNGTFEQGEKYWHLNVDEIKAGDSSISDDPNALSGSKVMNITRYKSHGGFYNEYQTTDRPTYVSEGEEIYAEGYYRKGSNGVAPYRVHLIASIHFKDGTVKRDYIRRYDTTDKWQKISGYFKMPKDSVKVYFGFGIFDMNDKDDVSVIFDSIYARKEIQGSSNSAVALRATNIDKRYYRGLGSKFTGMEANKYYLYLVDFKSDGKGIGGLAIRDERYGVYPYDNGLLKRIEFDTNETEWTTKYMKFKSLDHLEAARAYVYNLNNLGDEGITYYDNARIYEITSDVYDKIDKDPEYTGDNLTSKYPFRVGQLSNEVLTETVTAVGGTFYINGKEKKVEGDVPIQSERIMEAATYGNNLYIASGSGLLVYNGSTIAPIVPYLPDPLEELYIGTNALQTNSFEISDEEQSTTQIKQIRFSRRYGMTNKDISITVSSWKPSYIALEYKFERRNVRDKEDYWFTMQDWSRENTATFNTDIAGEYQFKISVREQGSENVLDDYKIPKYIIRPTGIDENDVPIDGNTIHQCNRIFVHWNRLVLYGDETKPDVMYLSDLNNPRYFPTNNSLQFVNPRKERITTIIPYRDDLVVFTPSSIQALFGTNPENFQRVMLNTDYGCISDRGAKVVKNHVIFPSYEGIALLKSVGTSETRFNVDLIDNKIKTLVEQVEDSVAYVRDNQYCLVYPTEEKQLRYYYEWGVWTYDKSTSLDMTDVTIEDNKLYALGTDGRLLLDSTQYADEGTDFDVVISTKMFDFGEPYSIKKTKELQLMFDPIEEATSLRVDVFLDEPYRGQVIEYTEEFDHETLYDPDEHTWLTTIEPASEHTIYKGFGEDNFKSEEDIMEFSKRNDVFMALSGGGTEGLQIKDGVVYQKSSVNQTVTESLAVYEDGTLGIVNGETDDLSNIYHSFHSDIPHLVNNGVKNTLDNSDVRPRHGIGQRNDGSYVIITVGGKPNEVSEGCTLDELANMFMGEECIVAYCLGEENIQTYKEGELWNIYFEGRSKKSSDFLYFNKDVVQVVEGARNGIIKSETIDINKEADIYKINTPGKGSTVGTYIIHSENKPLKIVGVGYVFKLKKP